MNAITWVERMSLCLALACAVHPVAAQQAGDAGAGKGTVSVGYADPQGFKEAREAAYRSGPEPDYLTELRRHLERAAPRQMREGERLNVTITDIDRAGAFEPWRGPNFSSVRIVKDLYPPRIDLRFEWLAPDGSTLKSGERQLRDPAFMMRVGGAYLNDPLRFEKALLDDWIAKELVHPRK